MKVNLDSLQRRREFLRLTGGIALGASAATIGLIPRLVLAGGCKAEIIKAPSKTSITVKSGLMVITPTSDESQKIGIVLIDNEHEAAAKTNPYKVCTEPKLRELEEKLKQS